MVYGIDLDGDGFPVIIDTEPPPPPVVYIPPAAYVAPPTPADLFRFLGWPPPDAEQDLSAQAHLSRAQLVVMSYVRHRGMFGEHLADDLAQIVLSLAGRTMPNPTGDSRVEAGTFKSSPGQPDLLLHELLVLQNYRRRAA